MKVNLSLVHADIHAALTEHPEQWCTTYLARDKHGHSVWVHAEAATQWCWYGWICKLLNLMESALTFEDHYTVLHKLTGNELGVAAWNELNVAAWNDEHTFEQVLARVKEIAEQNPPFIANLSSAFLSVVPEKYQVNDDQREITDSGADSGSIGGFEGSDNSVTLVSAAAAETR